MLLAREVILERGGGFGAGRRNPLGGRRRPLGDCLGPRTELPQGGIVFEFARELLKKARCLLLIRRGLARKAAVSVNKGNPAATWSRVSRSPRVVLFSRLLEHLARGRWKWFQVEHLALLT